MPTKNIYHDITPTMYNAYQSEDNGGYNIASIPVEIDLQLRGFHATLS